MLRKIHKENIFIFQLAINAFFFKSTPSKKEKKYSLVCGTGILAKQNLLSWIFALFFFSKNSKNKKYREFFFIGFAVVIGQPIK